MSTHHLSRIFQPDSIALIGAGARENSVGRTVMRNLASGGFEGRIYHVSPVSGDTDENPIPPQLYKLPDGVDLVVIATPIAGVPDILSVCGEKGVAGAVIVSGSYTGTNQPDKKIADEIRQIAGQTGIRVIGPDSVGMISTDAGVNASFMHGMPLPGKIAFLSQSGAVCTSVLDMALRENVGFSHFVSLGSMPDVSFADLIDFFGSQYEVESIIMVVERLSDIRNFMSAARAVSRVKPIIAMKSDRSGPDRMVCEDDIYDAAFKRAGILRVKEFEALFDCAEFIAKQKRPKGPRLAIVSNASGISAMAKDAMTSHGLKPAQLLPETIEKLNRTLHKNWSGINPIDLMLPSASREYIEAVKICMESEEIDGLLLLSSPVGTEDATALARELAALLNVCPCPVFTSWMGGRDIDNSRTVFNRAGIITYESPERAVRAFANLYQYGRNVEMLQQIPVRTDKRLEIQYDRAQKAVDQGLDAADGQMPDHLAKELAAAYGIPVSACSPDVPTDYELSISALRHDAFGPVIRFGMGGVLTHVFRDASMALPPLNRILARTAIEETKISQVFNGYESIRKVDIGLLEEILIRLSRLVSDFPQIRLIDINPLRVANGSITADHGRIILERTHHTGSSHLVISPYPYWQETSLTTKDGTSVFVRPVRPSDGQQMIDLFDDLSPETVYLRFFSPIKEISRPMLIRLTQIDYDREIALIALTGPKKKRKVIGVVRIIFMPEEKGAEFAIVLADAWQGKGLGIQLLKYALVCAKRYGIKSVWGPVITTNTGMLKMGQKLGFDVRHDPDSGEYKMTISLDTLENGSK